MIPIYKKRNAGVTLLELSLVLAIAGSITLFAIRSYQVFRLDEDVHQLQFNVDTIFNAMAQYYEVNCRGTIDATGKQVPGALNPDNNPPTPYFPIDISNDLRNGPGGAYLTINYPVDALVDTKGPGTMGYIAQFNYFTQNKLVCTETNGTPVLSGYDTNCKTTGQMATIVEWQAQVAVKLKDAQTANTFLKLLGATCVSDVAAGQTVTPCNQNPKAGSYVVWEREPMSSPETTSGFETFTPYLEQFKQMYTTYPILYLLNQNPQGTITPFNGVEQKQYLLCGS